MRFSLRGVLVALVGLVAIGGLVSTGALSTVSEGKVSAPKQSSGFCSSDGVSLVIDYGKKSDKQSVIACGESFSGTGWQLFAATEQKVVGTTEYPVGFVCRINGFPDAKDQPCTSTPTGAQGSWAYYYATVQLGNHWMFSAAGASMRKPKCGDVDAWVFLNPGEQTHEPAVTPMTRSCQH